MRGQPSKHADSYIVSSSPVGWLGLVAGNRGLVEITICTEREELYSLLSQGYPALPEQKSRVLGKAAGQLEQYFQGTLRVFDLPLDFRWLSLFSRNILQALARVPFGQNLTYGQLAAQAGRPGAARAVGRVMAENPFPLVIPCHRVVGTGGRLTGYSGGAGIATKAWLLEFEQRAQRAPLRGEPE